LSAHLELSPRDAALSDDAEKRTGLQLAVVRDRHGDAHTGASCLHDNVAAAPPNFSESVAEKDVADVAAGKDAQPTH